MKLKYLFLAIITVTLISACGSTKDVVYLQDIQFVKNQDIENDYQVTIHKDDLLGITVNSKNEELSLPFNLPLVSFQIGGGVAGQQRLMGYLVNQEGNIDFPILGQIHVAGLTRQQLIEYIKDKLISEDLIKDPIVTVQFLNFKVSVLGEVNKPGTFEITGDRVTLLEALSMAGDLSIYGNRERVSVIREVNGKRQIVHHDLRSSDLFESPCYYLQQNDIVYVEPNKARSGQSRVNSNNSVGVWLSGVSVLATITSLLISRKSVGYGTSVRFCFVLKFKCFN